MSYFKLVCLCFNGPFGDDLLAALKLGVCESSKTGTITKEPFVPQSL